MKRVLLLSSAAFIGLSSNVYAAQNGINYDPDHSGAWLEAQQDDQVDVMQKLFTRDLKQINEMKKFDTIKTYYSTYCTVKGNCIDPVAGLARDAGLKVMLGVYEFRTADSLDPVK